MVRAAGRFLCAILAGTVLCGCHVVGPTSISNGRPDYNRVIQQTSKAQVFSNIIRVRDNETMLFMDVTEVDAQLVFQAQVTGGAAGIGATAGTTGGTLAGRTGSASTTLQYEELPTIRYQPLLGQPLVQQISTPISVDSIAYLRASEWPFASILALAADRLAPGWATYFSALDAMIALDDKNALAFAATKSELTRAPEPKACTVTIQRGPAPSSTTATASPSCLKSLLGQSAAAESNDSLTLYLTAPPPASKDDPDLRRVLTLWLALLKIYSGTQPAYSPQVSLYTKQGITDTTDLTEVFNAVPKQIELRTVALSAKSLADQSATKLRSPASILSTRSALGILVASWAIPDPLFEVVSPDKFDQITKQEPWNSEARNRKCIDKSYYVLLPTDEDSKDHPDWHDDKGKAASLVSDVERRIKDSKSDDCLYTYSEDPVDPHEQYLGGLHRYLLIVESDSAPASSFASYFDERRAKWFYIDADDEISQKNFALIAQFLTMQATPPGPPLTPTISVGGRSG